MTWTHETLVRTASGPALPTRGGPATDCTRRIDLPTFRALLGDPTWYVVTQFLVTGRWYEQGLELAFELLACADRYHQDLSAREEARARMQLYALVLDMLDRLDGSMGHVPGGLASAPTAHGVYRRISRRRGDAPTIADRMTRAGRACNPSARVDTMPLRRSAIESSEVWRALTGAIQNQELLLDQERLGDHGASAAGAHQPSQGGDQVNQQDDQVAHRDILATSPRITRRDCLTIAGPMSNSPPTGH